VVLNSKAFDRWREENAERLSPGDSGTATHSGIAVQPVYTPLDLGDPGPEELARYDAKLGLLASSVNVYYFFVGVLFFLWRDRIPYSVWLLIPCAMLSYFLMMTPHGVYVTPMLLTYVTIFIGLTNVPRSRLLQSGDYSYGFYLYGFPISVVLAECFPVLRHNFLALMISAIVSTGLFAFLSWHLIEKRCRWRGRSGRRRWDSCSGMRRRDCRRSRSTRAIGR